MCGQSDKDCREAKFEMFSSVFSAIGEIVGLVVTGGASSSVTYALKVIEIYDKVKDFIDTVKLFREDAGLMNKLAQYAGAGGVIDAINEIIDTRVKIDALKTTEDPKNPSKDSDITKYRRRMIAMVAKFIGQDLLALLDPTGISGIIAAFAKPKCIENTNYMWFDTSSDGDVASPAIGVTLPSCASENGQCACVGTVAYGANGKFANKASTSTIGCTNKVFGDPIPGTVKSCYCPASTEANTKCADEGGQCTCFGTVAYGAEGKFISKAHFNVAFTCNNAEFGGDPIPGTVKACYCTSQNALPLLTYNTTVGVNIEGYDRNHVAVIAADGTDCTTTEIGSCGLAGQTGDATVPDCQTKCNQNPDCLGFVTHPYGAMMKYASATVCASTNSQYQSYKWWQKAQATKM